MSQLGRFFGCLVLTVCPVVACSVINSFDDVEPARGSGGDGGASEGGVGGRTTAGGDSNHGGSIGEAGSGEGGATPAGPIHGLLAVAGTDPTKGDASVVSLIDPTTGTELARQSLAGATVTGLAYDGAEGKDVWFEFTGVSFPAAPASKAAMQVFSFTDATASWKVVSAQTLPGLPPPRPDAFVVLNDRLSYLSAAGALTVLDTSNPKAVTQVKFTALDLGTGNEALGMVGTRGVPGDPTAPGGTLAIVVGSGCNGKQALRSCANVQLLSVTVGVGDNVMQGEALVPFSKATPVAPLVGEPAFSSAQAGQLGYVAFTTMLGKSVSLKHFDPRDLTKIESGSPALKSAWLGGLAYAECQDVALFTGVTQGSLYSASPAGLTAEVSLGYPGQSVVYEPFTQHAIALFNPDNTLFADSGFMSSGEGGAGGAASDTVPALDSFDVAKNAGLKRTAAAAWKPPTNLAPNLAVARFPVAYMCK